MPISFQCSSCGKKLKAPDAAAGKQVKCPQCGLKTKIPDADDAAGAEEQPEDDYGFMDPGVDEYESPAAPEGRTCPGCAESIESTAKECPYCGEVLDPKLKKKAQKKRARSSSADDADLSVGDWIFCIICSGLACIFGLVYMIQGKPKGAKMFAVSFGMVVFWNVLRFVIVPMLKQQP